MGNDFWLLSEFQNDDSPPSDGASGTVDANGNIVVSPSPKPFIGPEILGDRGLWDILALDEVILPGVWSVSVSLGTRLDMKSPKGFSAARIEFAGYRAAEITMTGIMWTESQWIAFLQDVVPSIRPQNTTDIPTSKAVSHPKLRCYGIYQLVIKDVDGPNESGSDPAGKQMQTVVIKAMEALPIEWKKDESKSKKDKLITSKGESNDMRFNEREIDQVWLNGEDDPDPATNMSYREPPNKVPIMTPIGTAGK